MKRIRCQTCGYRHYLRKDGICQRTHERVVWIDETKVKMEPYHKFVDSLSTEQLEFLCKCVNCVVDRKVLAVTLQQFSVVCKDTPIAGQEVLT